MKVAGIEEAFHGAATVGERGQVVIPARAREELGVAAGDKLLVFSHPGGCGVFFAKLEHMQRVAEALRPMLESVEECAENGKPPESGAQD